ncbi:hypothetical protein CEXT_457121 [Caerostris extrusa]|uniref:Uncharacterized protein n=1 Tax=Caerostris extrusa TaxID=172846 RepID=A0AAV4U5G2_CAEEX|nr:hypothetical protein CEXT_457121 [Caerostris extrusa]
MRFWIRGWQSRVVAGNVLLMGMSWKCASGHRLEDLCFCTFGMVGGDRISREFCWGCFVFYSCFVFWLTTYGILEKDRSGRNVCIIMYKIKSNQYLLRLLGNMSLLC